MNPETNQDGKKIRPDAKLKLLPPERQDAIAAYATHHSLAQTAQWLEGEGIDVADTTVSAFLRWYRLKQQSRLDQETTETLMELLRDETSDLTDEQLDSFGRRTFSLLCIRNQDMAGFLRMRGAIHEATQDEEKLELKRQAEERLQKALALSREKFEWDTAEQCLKHAATLREIAVNPSLDQTAKIEQIRQCLFGELPPASLN